MLGPIFARELLTTPRRAQHYLLRGAGLGLMFVLLWTAWQLVIGFQHAQKLGDLALFNQILFLFFAHTQTVLALFAAALFGVLSISQEKDRRTLILLLVTHLRDDEIVTDKFLGGLLHVVGMLIAALPIYMVCLLMGGVGTAQVVGVHAVILGGALGGTAVGVVVALWREKTFQSVALTLLVLVLATLGVEAWAAVGPTLLGMSAGQWATLVSPVRAVHALALGD